MCGDTPPCFELCPSVCPTDQAEVVLIPFVEMTTKHSDLVAESIEVTNRSVDVFEDTWIGRLVAAKVGVLSCSAGLRLHPFRNAHDGLKEAGARFDDDGFVVDRPVGEIAIMATKPGWPLLIAVRALLHLERLVNLIVD